MKPSPLSPFDLNTPWKEKEEKKKEREKEKKERERKKKEKKKKKKKEKRGTFPLPQVLSTVVNIVPIIIGRSF